MSGRLVNAQKEKFKEVQVDPHVLIYFHQDTSHPSQTRQVEWLGRELNITGCASIPSHSSLRNHNARLLYDTFLAVHTLRMYFS